MSSAVDKLLEKINYMSEVVKTIEAENSYRQAKYRELNDKITRLENRIIRLEVEQTNITVNPVPNSNDRYTITRNGTTVNNAVSNATTVGNVTTGDVAYINDVNIDWDTLSFHYSDGRETSINTRGL